MSLTDLTKIARVQHRQGITRYWQYFGEEAILGKGEWGVEFWPTIDTLSLFEKLIRSKYDPAFTAPPLTIEEAAHEGSIRSVRLGVGLPWNKTPFTLYAQNPEQPETAYNHQITGLRDGQNKVYQLPKTYKPGSLKVFVNGARQTPGADSDYTEQAPNRFVLASAPAEDEQLLVDYTVFTV
jgi:hypothetical protein